MFISHSRHAHHHHAHQKHQQEEVVLEPKKPRQTKVVAQSSANTSVNKSKLSFPVHYSSSSEKLTYINGGVLASPTPSIPPPTRSTSTLPPVHNVAKQQKKSSETYMQKSHWRTATDGGKISLSSVAATKALVTNKKTNLVPYQHAQQRRPTMPINRNSFVAQAAQAPPPPIPTSTLPSAAATSKIQLPTRYNILNEYRNHKPTPTTTDTAAILARKLLPLTTKSKTTSTTTPTTTSSSTLSLSKSTLLANYSTGLYSQSANYVPIVNSRCYSTDDDEDDNSGGEEVVMDDDGQYCDHIVDAHRDHIQKLPIFNEKNRAGILYNQKYLNNCISGGGGHGGLNAKTFKHSFQKTFHPANTTTSSSHHQYDYIVRVGHFIFVIWEGTFLFK